MRSASLEWITVVQDLFLEHASPARIAEWLDGEIDGGPDYIVVRSMRAIEGFDATILVKDGRAKSFTVWYRDIERPTLAAAELVLGRAVPHRALFELVFEDAIRPLDDKRIVTSCSVDNSAEKRLVGLALVVI